jgi:hypothetical protein
METDAPWLVRIPNHVRDVIGEPDPKHSRLFRASGDEGAYRKWWDTIAGTWRRGLMSPGGAAMQAGVSRAAVHKALKEGRLTGFVFHVEQVKKAPLGLGRSRRVLRATPYLYIPVAECRAWGEYLLAAMRQEVERGTAAEEVATKWQRELDGERPDFTGFFIDLPPGRRRKS